jgi:predicted dehydrogenase
LAEPASVGLIGFGLAGACFHAPFIAATPGLRLAAVVTSHPERRHAAAHEYPDARLFNTPEELWTLRPRIDAVVIASPNRAHVPLARRAIADGIGVVVDKPMAATSAEARQVVIEAKARGTLLTVFQNRRWDGDFQTLKQLLAEGRLGDPLRFESRFERWRPVAPEGWRQSPDPGDAGGLLYDLGSHLIDQAVTLFGPVDQIYAELDRRSHAQVDNDTFVAIRHQSGVRSHLGMSVMAAHAGPRFRLLGSRAAYVKFGMDPQEAALREGARPGGADWGVEPADRWGTLGHGDALERVPTRAGGYQHFYAGVAAALQGAPPPVDPHDAVDVLTLIEAAQQSAEERRVIHL